MSVDPRVYRMRRQAILPTDIPEPCQKSRTQALVRQARLTKPSGALGALEELAVRLAGLYGTERPAIDRVAITVFAADHGVVAEGVSAYPQAVTREMLRNFLSGGAAISVLARAIQARLEVVDVGVVEPLHDCGGLYVARAGAGTANFVEQPAMSGVQLERALNAGREAIERVRGARAQLFVGGEMGIGNSTSASAVACAWLGADPVIMAGPGTGLDEVGVAHKRAVIAAGLSRHRAALGDPLEVLRRLGGFEIAALCSAYLHAAAGAIPVLVDGFIASVAALLAVGVHAAVGEWLFYAHRSAEPGHGQVLGALGVRPLLDLGMRLGEGSGAALAVPILRLACALHGGMATFDEAAVSGPAP
jgi:nicotinate-nucleotide--dimethylbenzimidazole phosphoribosyltransferase